MSDQDTQKQAHFQEIAATLAQQGFTIAQQDQTRPWGGFFVIDESQAQQFADQYFEGRSVDELRISPKQRLSWQYHFRRAEIWKVVQGPVGVATSQTDAEGEVKTYEPGALIVLKQGERHRLVGLDGWGVIAEIWQHTDADKPSDEDDIVRVQDDFGR
jgi:mannose-6-phosphate isomerase